MKNNDWIESLSDETISFLLKKELNLKEVPYFLNNKILSQLQNPPVNQKLSHRRIIPVLLSSAIVLIFMMTSVFILFYSGPLNAKETGVVGAVSIIDRSEIVNTIYEGVTIATDVDSFYRIEIEGRGIVTLDKSTNITIERLDKGLINDNTIIKLNEGRLLLEIDPLKFGSDFIIKTPAGVVKVIGTHYSVQYFNNEMNVTVIDGVVSVITDSLSVNVEAGRYFSTLNGGVRDLTESEISIFEHLKNVFDNKISDEDLPDIDSENDIIELKPEEFIVNRIGSAASRIEPTKSKVLSIIGAGDISIITTESSLAFANQSGIIKILDYGGNTGIYFQSKPVIMEGKLYIISTTQKLLIIDIDTMNEITRSAVSGSMIFGFEIVQNQGGFRVPFINGVHFLNSDGSFDLNKIIRLNNPTTPLIMDNKIFAVSYLENKSVFFETKTASRIASFSLNNRAIINPVIIDNIIYVFDQTGTAYRYKADATEIPAIQTGVVPVSNMYLYGRFGYQLTADGYLNRFNPVDCSYLRIIKIEDNVDLTMGLFKKPVIFDGYIYTGTSDGRIIKINVFNYSDIEEIKISDYGFTGNSSAINGIIYSGTSDGSIFTGTIR